MASRLPLLPGINSNIPKSFRGETHRMTAPSETVAQMRKWMPFMGITRIANLTGLDRIGIPVVAVYRPNSRSISVSQGKGANLAAAQASGLMESIEAYHAENINLPLRLASYRDTSRLVPTTNPSRFPISTTG